jgi:hypothetical protein
MRDGIILQVAKRLSKYSYWEPEFWCWICFRVVREFDPIQAHPYLSWSRSTRGALARSTRNAPARRRNEIKWVTIHGEEVPICPYCGNLLKNQSRRLIIKSWMKYGLIGILIFFIIWILAKIIELAS